MNEDVNGDVDYTANDEAVAQNVFVGRGRTLEEALSNGAGHALRRHPAGTAFEIRMWGEIHNPRVSEYRVLLTKLTPPV